MTRKEEEKSDFCVWWWADIGIKLATTHVLICIWCEILPFRQYQVLLEVKGKVQSDEAFVLYTMGKLRPLDTSGEYKTYEFLFFTCLLKSDRLSNSSTEYTLRFCCCYNDGKIIFCCFCCVIASSMCPIQKHKLPHSRQCQRWICCRIQALTFNVFCWD